MDNPSDLPILLALPIPDGYHIRKPADICYCQANHQGTWIFCQDGRKYLSSKSIRQLEELLPPGFFRIHSSALVNLAHISSFISSRSLSVMMSDGETLAVSRRNQKKLKEALVLL